MGKELILTDFISVEMLQKIQDAFSDMVGMAALTADKNGTAVTHGSNFSDFCMKYTRSSPLGAQYCKECDRMGAHMAMDMGRPSVYFCHAGLIDYAAPILANGKIVGCFIGGQVLSHEPDIERIAKVADRLGIDRDEYIEAAKKVRIVDKMTIDKAAAFLYTFSGVLSDIAYSGYRMYRSNIEIEKSAQAKSDFLANMSHEIRTPMNAVLGMAEMALREEMSSSARNYLHQIRASGKNLLVIINDILDFSKIESGKMDIVPATYEPLSTINDMASIVNSRIGDKNIEFTMDISPELPTKLLGDSVRIQQILINLLNNAVKFTPHGHVRLKVDFERGEGDMIILKASVSDTGTGIKREDMDKIFRSFQQVDSKRNRNIEGTGLGLAISRQLLLLMDGSITVESEYNVGSTFSVRLPQKVVCEAEPLPGHDKQMSVALIIDNVYIREQIERDLDRIEVKHIDIEAARTYDLSGYDFIIVECSLFGENLETHFKSDPGSKCILIDEFDSEYKPGLPNVRVIRKPVYYLNLYYALGLINEYIRDDAQFADDFIFIAPEARVLIVDDNQVNLTVAKGLIEPLKMQVDTACSAMETIEMIKKTPYDIIFMDHMMPEVDGVETTHIIRRLIPSYAEVPIIALTANAVEGTKEMFITEGMNDFVAKPIDVKDIVSKIRKWLPQGKIIPVDNTVSSISEKPSKLPKIKGLNVNEAMGLLGSEELFRTVLKEYYCSISKKAFLIEEFYHNERWKDYTIEVHSLKSTSRQIGADELSALAAELERAGHDGDIGLIYEKTEEMLEKYRAYIEILKPYFPECETVDTKKTAEPAEILHMLDDLQAALDDFDTLAIDDAIEKMSGYIFDNEYNKLFQQLKDAAEEGDFDTCCEIAAKCREYAVSVFIGNI